MADQKPLRRSVTDSHTTRSRLVVRASHDGKSNYDELERLCSLQLRFKEELLTAIGDELKDLGLCCNALLDIGAQVELRRLAKNTAQSYRTDKPPDEPTNQRMRLLGQLDDEFTQWGRVSLVKSTQPANFASRSRL
jgi:hypothetical protein